MRKIDMQTDIERKKKRNNLILGVIMILLVGLSSLGYAVMSRTGESNSANFFKYQGLTFVKSNGFWALNLAGKTLYFSKLPAEVSSIPIEGNYSLDRYYNLPLYVVNSNAAAGNIVTALDGVYLRVQDACLEGKTCPNSELPIKTCADNVIIFEEKAETSVYSQENCVYITGNFYDGTDRFLYRLFGIA